MNASTPPEGDDRAPSDAIVRMAQPSPASRLNVPAETRPPEPAPPDPVPPEDPIAAQPLAPPKAAPADRRDRVKPLKKIERYLAALFKFGRTEWMAKQGLRTAEEGLHKASEAEKQLADLRQNMADQVHNLSQVRLSIDALEETLGAQDAQLPRQMAHYKAGLAVLSRSVSDLTLRLDRLMMREGAFAPAPVVAPDTADLLAADGFAAFKDQFYNRLEHNYRGTRAEIMRRLRTYMPDVEAAFVRTGRKPVLDLGCGRGEWLELLAEVDITGFGVDTNAVQIAEGQELGLDLRLGDALKVLAEAETGSLSMISAHHLIEHLPFDMVAWITREALRVLAPGGILLFETPNTRNVLVGATTFHTDPTHLKPMPEQVMGVLLETAGFHPVEIRHLNAHERFDEFMARPGFDPELAFLLFGPQDLCVLGTKPQAEG